MRRLFFSHFPGTGNAQLTLDLLFPTWLPFSPASLCTGFQDNGSACQGPMDVGPAVQLLRLTSPVQLEQLPHMWHHFRHRVQLCSGCSFPQASIPVRWHVLWATRRVKVYIISGVSSSNDSFNKSRNIIHIIPSHEGCSGATFYKIRIEITGN